MLEASHGHTSSPKPKPQRPLFCRTLRWHRGILQTLTIGKAVRHRYRAQM